METAFVELNVVMDKKFGNACFQNVMGRSNTVNKRAVYIQSMVQVIKSVLRERYKITGNYE